MHQRDNTIQKAFNTRMEIAKQKYSHYEKKEIVLFKPQKVSAEKKSKLI